MDIILPWTRFFCNVHLFRVPRSWTGSVQMKSSMTFIQGNRCIERERYFKSREVKRLKECALALRSLNCIVIYIVVRYAFKALKDFCIFIIFVSIKGIRFRCKYNHKMTCNSLLLEYGCFGENDCNGCP